MAEGGAKWSDTGVTTIPEIKETAAETPPVKPMTFQERLNSTPSKVIAVIDPAPLWVQVLSMLREDGEYIEARQMAMRLEVEEDELNDVLCKLTVDHRVLCDGNCRFKIAEERSIGSDDDEPTLSGDLQQQVDQLSAALAKQDTQFTQQLAEQSKRIDDLTSLVMQLRSQQPTLVVPAASLPQYQ